MTKSHVFVTRGSLTNFACDAWLLPTDQTYSIRSHWRDAVPGLQDHVDRSRVAGFSTGARLALALEEWDLAQPLPVLTAVPLLGIRSTEELVPPIRQFIQVAAEFSAKRRADGGGTKRPVPLLAMPLFGTGGGGASRWRGEFLQRLLREARLAGAEAGVDVALVLTSEKDFALAQELRKRDRQGFWSSLEASLQDEAADLARDARAGKLVPFMGAGVSMSSGAPDWQSLLEGLAGEAQLSELERDSLAKRDFLDQASLLRTIYEDRRGEESPSFNELVAEKVHLGRYGLAPALLASLRTREAITLNYDGLFEMASADVGLHRTVIPGGTKERENWLLKLHGSVQSPESIILTRDDYLGFQASRNALAALVKATLITHRLLFVGFGLQDDHFHEIAHDVRQALPDGQAPEVATALTLHRDPLDDLAWANRLKLVHMSEGDNSGNAARTLEVFLDLLAALSTDSHSYLLADGYAEALTPAEKTLREKLRKLHLDLTEEELSTSGGVRLRQVLGELGDPEVHRYP